MLDIVPDPPDVMRVYPAGRRRQPVAMTIHGLHHLDRTHALALPDARTRFHDSLDATAKDLAKHSPDASAYVVRSAALTSVCHGLIPGLRQALDTSVQEYGEKGKLREFVGQLNVMMAELTAYRLGIAVQFGLASPESIARTDERLLCFQEELVRVGTYQGPWFDGTKFWVD